MDNIVRPDMKCWVSPPIALGESMDAILTIGVETGTIKKFDQAEAQLEMTRTEKKVVVEEEVEVASSENMMALVLVKEKKDVEPDNQVEIANEMEEEEVTTPENNMALSTIVRVGEESFESWLKMGVKSTSHRLLSGDSKYAEHMERALAEKNARDLKYAEKCKDLHMDSQLRMDEKLFEKMQAESSPILGSVKGEAFQDVVLGAVMPILIPPIPDADKIDLKSIAMLLCSSNPVGPIWRSNNLQQQIDEKLQLDTEQKKSRERLTDFAEGESNLVDNMNDFIVEVSMFCGRSPEESLPAEVKMYIEPTLVYKLHLLGTNTVMDLRNALHCDSEFVKTSEVQSPDDPECSRRHDEILKNQTSDWLLLVHDKIYCDDTSDGFSVITKWINQSAPPKNVGPFQKGDNKDMLRNLSLRFGYPYIYIHQGTCEHIIVFNTIRTILDTDEHRIEKYPVIATIPYLKNIYCRVDGEHMATWSVHDCPKLPENPMILCTRCLKEFCYKSDGTKRCDFHLFPYRQLANEI